MTSLVTPSPILGPTTPLPIRWTKLDPTGEVPPGRDYHSMVYDSGADRLILFGGWNGSMVFNDTWAYDPASNTWSKLNPAGDVPPARDYLSMVCDPATGKTILFGGFDGVTQSDDTWAYSSNLP